MYYPTVTDEQRTILVVDDDEALLTVASRVLRLYGFEVHSASNCEEALALSRSLAKPVDLLLTDVMLPGMNGCQLAELLTQAHPETRVLYTSGYPYDVVSTGVPHLVGGAPQFIEKPFAASELARRVQQVLDDTPPAH